jgi:hypothetical protein
MKTNALVRGVVRIALVAAVGATVATAREVTSQGTDARTAFARMKSLSGDWTGPKMMGHRLDVNYRVISGGSAVLATFFPGTSMEMITVYYLKGDSLVQTHYCLLANQPRAKLNLKKSSADTLVFDFAGGDNIKSTQKNMHGETLRFLGANKIESTCASSERGKPDTTHTVTLLRKR